MHPILRPAALALGLALVLQPAHAQTQTTAGTQAPEETQAPDASAVVAVVNGEPITLGHMIALRSQLPERVAAMPPEQLYEAILDQLITQRLLAGEVDDLTTLQKRIMENLDAALRADRHMDEIAAPATDEAAIETAYQARIEAFQGQPEYNASHILLPTKEEAEAVLQEIRAGADFAEMARQKSTGPSGPNGGQLGWFGKGQMVPEFEQAVEGMEPGEVAGPVQTQFGWHLIKLNDKRSTTPPPLESVREEIRQELAQAAIQKEIERLRSEASIEKPELKIDPAAINDLSLVEE